MGHVPLLDELAIVAALAVVVTVLLARFQLPTVAGLLASGALLGPYGLHLATSVDSIEILAEVGVVLLLFTIGLEFSLARLKVIFRQVALGGFLQVALTMLVTVLVARAFGEPMGRSVFYGFVFALSSTAIVLRNLAERRELDAPHGQFIVGTLIFQDLCVVPMMLIVPLLSGGRELGESAISIAVALGKAFAVVVGTIILARVVVPRLLDLVDASRSREIFLVAILGLCIGTAWLTSLSGLSLALGAFLGEMVVADTEYGHRAMGDILPLRHAFVSVFFISLGMLFDVSVFLEQPILVLSLLGGFLLFKGFIATLAAMAMRFPSRVAWLSGVGLAQFGEFGFVLTQVAEDAGVIEKEAVGPLLTAGIFSMFLTPLLVRAAPHITAGEKLLGPLERLIGVRGIDQISASKKVLEGHVVVVGYGVAGKLAARALKASTTPFVVLEMNVENVRLGRDEKMPVYYGDATSEEALQHAHLAAARLVVLLINDHQAATRVVDTIHRVAPDVPVLARTHYLNERGMYFDLGARDVVAEEVEGAVEVIQRMLRWVETPRNVIEDLIRAARSETQTSERKMTLPRPRLSDFSALSDMKIEAALVREASPLVGASPSGLRLRSRTGALVVGVRRGDALLENPDPQVPFEAGDVVYLVGTGDGLRTALALFNEAQEEDDPREEVR